MKTHIILFLSLVGVCFQGTLAQTFSPGIIPNEGWVYVPENTGGLGLPAFYVMKYEARAYNINSNTLHNGSPTSYLGSTPPPPGVLDSSLYKPVSVPKGYPWKSISSFAASDECQSLGKGYDLISNVEWMALARDIEQLPENWTGGQVGSGCLFSGNHFSGCGGYQTFYAGEPALDTGAPQTRNIRASHLISTRERIFDLAGNLSEWVDWNKNIAGFQFAQLGCSSALVWYEFQQVPSICSNIAFNDYSPSNTTYNSNHGVGAFLEAPSSVFEVGQVSRGGHVIGPKPGLFEFHLLSVIHGSASPNTGFRCVYRPKKIINIKLPPKL